MLCHYTRTQVARTRWGSCQKQQGSSVDGWRDRVGATAAIAPTVPVVGRLIKGSRTGWRCACACRDEKTPPLAPPPGQARPPLARRPLSDKHSRRRCRPPIALT